MTIRQRFQRAAVAFILVLGLLAAPALPAAADEGWTQGITEWVTGWITGWQSPSPGYADRDFKERGVSSHEPLRPTPYLDPSDEDPDFNLQEIVPFTQEEQACEAHPSTDPFGQC